MNYSGNMPDWHQYNPPQSGRSTTTSHPQNATTSHHFMGNITPPALDNINLSTSQSSALKHQRNEVNYPRNYPTSNIPGTCSTSTALTTPGGHMASLANCPGHYGPPSRPPILDPPSLHPPLNLTDSELPHRTPQMTFPTPSNHPNPTLTVNPNLHTGGLTSQSSPVAPLSPGRQPYPCKLPCCNPDTQMAYQHWEKYNSYQTNSTYRENHQRPGYSMENRRYVAEMNLRKDCGENKEHPGSFPGSSVDHRRSYDYKYRKEMSRNYPSSGIHPNYPIPNYNFPADCQKCPHSAKDYMRRGGTSSSMNQPNQQMMKYPEQQIPQKYSPKLPYQNGNHQATMPTTNSGNLPSPLQNSYFNSSISRDVPRDFNREYQEANAANRIPPPANPPIIHGSYQKYHVYQQKIAMQRFTLENHLRGMARLPGYQSHPKYQEYAMRYRELLRLQQNVDCQTFLPDPKVTPTSPNPPVPPINLQFDQNGCLINSSFPHPHYPGVHNPVNPPPTAESSEASPQTSTNVLNPLEQNPYKHQEQSMSMCRDDAVHHLKCHPPYPMPERPANFDNMIVDVDRIDPTRTITSATATMSTTTAPTTDLANSKEFNDKPQLDVRQFLANWDETEEEEGNANTQEVLSNTTSVIVGNVTAVDGESHNNKVCNDLENSNQKQDQTHNLNLNQNQSQHGTQNANQHYNQNHTEQPKILETSPVSATASLNIETNVIGTTEVEDMDSASALKTIEEFTNSGAIVQCIQTDSSDIPTIHIVDHLPQESELATIRTVYGDMTSLSIEHIAAAPIEILNDNPEGGETITLFGQDTGVCSKETECSNEGPEEVAAVIKEVAAMKTSPPSKSPGSESNNSNDQSTAVEIPEVTAPISQPEVHQMNQTSDSTPLTTSMTSSLRKQHSFASEESHNPDDISLPDLPMSECTPISTTLNTPIHSESEESTGPVENLSISTNPIEIIQNSPIISFTHSPLKTDPYSTLETDGLSEKPRHDTLDFDFSSSSSRKSPIENFEIAKRTSPKSHSSSNSLEKSDEQLKVPLITDKSDKDQEFYPSSDPLMGMNKTKKNSTAIIDSSNDITQVGECSVGSLNGNSVPGTPVSRILSTDEIDTGKCPSIIDTEDFQPTDDLDKLCNISLDSSCMLPLLPEDSQGPRLSAVAIDGFKTVLPITNLDELDSSDEDKDHNDWVEVGSMDECVEPKSANEMIITSNENPSIEATLRENEHKSADKREGSIRDKVKYIRSIFDTSEDSQTTGFDEVMKKRAERKTKDRLNIISEYRRDKINTLENVNITKTQNESEITPSQPQADNSHIDSLIGRRRSMEQISGEIPNDSTYEKDQGGRKNESLKTESCKITQSFRRTHKDTDVEIHVANINVEKLCNSTNEQVDAIEIKINVSRHDKKRRLKSLEKSDDRQKEAKKTYFAKFENGNYRPQKIFPRRRISNPEESEPRKNKHIRRRHSGGHNYRSHRKSTEGRKKMERSHFEPLPKLLPLPKSINKSETSEVSFSDGPLSSHDDSQISTGPSMPTETQNTCDSQYTEEESVFEEVELSKSRNPSRKASLDYDNFAPGFDELENMASRSSQAKLPGTSLSLITPGPSNASQTNDLWSKINFSVDTSTIDFDNFDMAPNEGDVQMPMDDQTSSTMTEDRALSRRLEECEKYRNPYSRTPGHEAIDLNLNTVPVYTTRDGKIKYSPNPRYTYRMLIMEARQREGYPCDFLRENPSLDRGKDNQPKLLQQRRHNSPSKEDRRKHWSEYHTTRFKQSSSRKRSEDSSWRSNRSNKYDRWRERPPELESDNISIGSSMSEVNKWRPEKKSEGFNIGEDFNIPSKTINTGHTDGERGIDSLMVGSINNLTVASHDSKTEPIMNSATCVNARIFNGDELELFSGMDTVQKIYDGNQGDELAALKDFEEIMENEMVMDTEVRNGLKPSELSEEDSKDPKGVVEFIKPPLSVDIEQDSQAILTDSGLESSTTYIEGSKEPKRLSIWRRDIIINSERISAIKNFEKIPEVVSESKDSRVQCDKGGENERDKGQVEDILQIPVVPNNTKADETNNTERREEDSQKFNELAETIAEIAEHNIPGPENSKDNAEPNISSVKNLKIFLSKNHKNDCQSRLVKGLDLASPIRRFTKLEEPKIRIEITKEDSITNEDSGLQPVAICREQSSNFSPVKVSEVPSRRASSDEIHNSREKFPSFEPKFVTMQLIKSVSNFKNVQNNDKTPQEAENVEMRGNQDERLLTRILENSPVTGHRFEKPEVPSLNLAKLLVSKARKLRQTETPEVSTESEVSTFEETLSSTQFGSEYAASKQDSTSIGVNFLSTSSQEAIDATDVKEIRKNLALCALEDKSESVDNTLIISHQNKMEECEKMFTFSGKISSESEDDSNAQDGSPIGRKLEEEEVKHEKNEDNVLNFSGKIQSPEAPPDAHISSSLPVDPPEESEERIPMLSFSGKIPSPKNSEDFSPKYDNNLIELSSRKNDEAKHLTFTGRIQSESPPKSPTTFDKIPKFIIKKTDCSSRSSSISQIFPSDISAQRSLDSHASSSHRLSLHPKIPKMIIRNVRSRPGTPTIEENAVELSFPKTNDPENEKVFEVKIKLDDKSSRADSCTPIRKSLGIIECNKVPKMKIKLEDKHSKMTFENASMELSMNDSETFNNVPKLKIRKIRKSSPPQDRKITESLHNNVDVRSIKPTIFTESSLSIESSLHLSDVDEKIDRIPKMKIKKQDSRKSSPSPDPLKKKRPRSPLDSSGKRLKKSSSRHRSAEAHDLRPSLIDSETTNSTTGLSEKIPKVIIKRTSSTSEFKCELSKDGAEAIIKNSRWQPEVKLERFKVLDSLAKEQNRVHLPVHILEEVTRSLEVDERTMSLRKLKRTSSVPSRRGDESDRSSSRGRRRYSDPEQQQCRIDDSDSDDLPRTGRRRFTRPLPDFSSHEESLDTRSDLSSAIPKTNDLPHKEDSSVLIAESVESSRSECQYPGISSHKPLMLCPQEPLVSTESIVDATGDTKSSEDQSVIKLESSDESQTTIEMLPASSDISQPEPEIPMPLEGERRIANGSMARLYTSEAIPTQFELELEIVDNSSESMDVPVPGVQSSPSTAHEDYWKHQNEYLPHAPGPSLIHRTHENELDDVNSEAKSMCSSDSLVKDVLAAKETLKRYLASSKNVTPATPAPRMKTAAEKKQFSAECSAILSSQERVKSSSKQSSVFQKEISKESRHREDRSKRHSSSSSEKRDKVKVKEDSVTADKGLGHKSSSNSTKGLKRERRRSESTEISSKKMRPPSTSESSRKGSTSKSETSSKSDGGSRSHKSSNSSRSHGKSRREGTEEKKKSEAMPVLVPEGGIAFEPSLRETSRSPPVITKQESSELNPESPKKVEEEASEKIREIIEQESEGMTFADIVTKMAYHEKATIKHKRYCILCERWFPTTARHRRHLSGYQHRHTELTQRRTVHALFMLFTGKPCPRLLPSSIVRTDCAPGEPTPLQIAVQDVAISLEKGAMDKAKT